jgi:hypothetical protein
VRLLPHLGREIHSSHLRKGTEARRVTEAGKKRRSQEDMQRFCEKLRIITDNSGPPGGT